MDSFPGLLSHFKTPWRSSGIFQISNTWLWNAQSCWECQITFQWTSFEASSIILNPHCGDLGHINVVNRPQTALHARSECPLVPLCSYFSNHAIIARFNSILPPYLVWREWSHCILVCAGCRRCSENRAAVQRGGKLPNIEQLFAAFQTINHRWDRGLRCSIGQGRKTKDKNWRKIKLIGNIFYSCFFPRNYAIFVNNFDFRN